MSSSATKHDQGKVQLSMCTASFFNAVVHEDTPRALITTCLLKAAHAKTLIDFEKHIKDALNKTKVYLFDGDGWKMYHGLARVLEYGSEKYSRNNWKLGFSYSRILDAALRHAELVLCLDNETSLPHEYHLTFCLSVLLEQMYTGTGENDITVIN